MSARPKLTPAGQIEVDGALYRVLDPTDDDRYSVVRESDGVTVGRFVLKELGVLPHANAVDAGSREPELVLAIARLLASPRGALPLQ